jgi:hypothetical protein
VKVVEAQITTFLTHILDSQDARHAAQELEGSSAQSFVDAIQNVCFSPSSLFYSSNLDGQVLNWGLADASSRAKARQFMRKVAEAGEQLPSSLFITGVNDHDEHPTFGGGFGDVYQASYDGKRVALKRIRTFTADSTTRRNRLVNSLLFRITLTVHGSITAILQGGTGLAESPPSFHSSTAGYRSFNVCAVVLYGFALDEVRDRTEAPTRPRSWGRKSIG